MRFPVPRPCWLMADIFKLNHAFDADRAKMDAANAPAVRCRLFIAPFQNIADSQHAGRHRITAHLGVFSLAVLASACSSWRRNASLLGGTACGREIVNA